jgi:hypothetical protein
MGWLEIGNQVIAVLSSVSEIGLVRFGPASRVELGELAKELGVKISEKTRIRVWFVSRSRVANVREGAPTQRGWRDHTFLIQGYMSFSPEGSTELFNDLIERVMDAFETKMTLNKTAFYVYPLTCREISFDDLGPIRCHYCELELVVREYRAVVYGD